MPQHIVFHPHHQHHPHSTSLFHGWNGTLVTLLVLAHVACIAYWLYALSTNTKPASRSRQRLLSAYTCVYEWAAKTPASAKEY